MYKIINLTTGEQHTSEQETIFRMLDEYYGTDKFNITSHDIKTARVINITIQPDSETLIVFQES